MIGEHQYIVVIAGGGGTRLWPLSRKARPKQLQPLLGEETLFQSTLKRLEGFVSPDHILVVSVESQAASLRAQAPNIPSENFLIEPMPRGTASAVGLAAMILAKRDAGSAMAVLPADHFIGNADLFRSLLDTAFDVAEQNYLVTLGIAPNGPSTAYGYIEQGQRLDGDYRHPVYTVRRFIEKPDEAAAKQLIHDGNNFWNSGIFIWRTAAILAEIKSRLPKLDTALARIGAAWDSHALGKVLTDNWESLANETIDYGIMEQAARVAVIPTSGLKWSDVGMWSSLFEVLKPDSDGNIIVNDALHIVHDTHNTLIFGSDAQRLVVTVGVTGLVIVDTGDVLLVCKADDAQKIRDVVEQLQAQQQERYL